MDYYIGPGEIIFISPDGYEQLEKPGEKMQICAFLWVYYGYPPSNYENINVEEVRYRCGRALARNDHVKADLVSGIPDSGIGHALGTGKTYPLYAALCEIYSNLAEKLYAAKSGNEGSCCQDETDPK
ncbi:MAG: hypothetical protein J7L53_07170 [Deltaproteobacteria bacterium]|nr:hypothetical protein [Deltaproteobacteria bacterium]